MLAATGRDANEIVQCEQQFAAHVERLRASGSVAGNARQRAAAVHRFLHSALLRGTFDPAASDPGVAMSGGPYNCASATAISLALLQEFDVDACAVSVVGHVWCRIKAPQGAFDVETTCRDWYLLAEQRAPHPQAAARQSPQWREHLRRAAAGRTLDESAFLAIFHYNQGVRMLREGQFPAAATANLAALWLDWRCRPAYENLAAALGGWSAVCGSLGETASPSAQAR